MKTIKMRILLGSAIFFFPVSWILYVFVCMMWAKQGFNVYTYVCVVASYTTPHVDNVKNKSVIWPVSFQQTELIMKIN